MKDWCFQIVTLSIQAWVKWLLIQCWTQSPWLRCLPVVVTLLSILSVFPVILSYIKCARKTKSGKKCLSTIYLRNAPISSCKNCSTNSVLSKITKEQLTIEDAWCHSVTLSSSLDKKSLESGGSLRTLRFLKKL